MVCGSVDFVCGHNWPALKKGPNGVKVEGELQLVLFAGFIPETSVASTIGVLWNAFVKIGFVLFYLLVCFISRTYIAYSVAVCFISRTFIAYSVTVCFISRTFIACSVAVLIGAFA